MGSAAWPAEIRHMHTAGPLLSIPGFERESVSGAVSFEAADGRRCLKSSPQLLLHLCFWTAAQVSLSFMQDWQWFNIKFSCCYLSHNWFTQTFSWNVCYSPCLSTLTQFCKSDSSTLWAENSICWNKAETQVRVDHSVRLRSPFHCGPPY